jgi:hypothetical protein
MAGVAAAAVISQGQVPPAGPGMSGREPARIISGAEAGKKEIHIHIGNISLPNAIDAKGFVDEFIKLAEGYDV